MKNIVIVGLLVLVGALGAMLVLSLSHGNRAPLPQQPVAPPVSLETDAALHVEPPAATQFVRVPEPAEEPTPSSNKNTILFADDFNQASETELARNWIVTTEGTASTSFENSQLILSTGTENSLARIRSRSLWRLGDYQQLALECRMKVVIPGIPNDWGTNQFGALIGDHNLPTGIGFLFDKVSDNVCKSVTVDKGSITASDNTVNVRSGFHVYKWIATREQVAFYVDGTLVQTHRRNIPWNEALRLLFVIVNGRYSENHQMIIDYVRLERSVQRVSTGPASFREFR